MMVETIVAAILDKRASVSCGYSTLCAVLIEGLETPDLWLLSWSQTAAPVCLYYGHKGM